MKKEFDVVKWVGAVIGILSFVFGGGFIYNQIWQNKSLTYSILPEYDLGSQKFSGVVIENRGAVNLTDLEIVISNLESNIAKLNIPDPHETLNIADGGEGSNKLILKMPRLSSRASVAVYILTDNNITIDSKKIIVTSKEIVGQPVADATNRQQVLESLLVTIILSLGTALLVSYVKYKSEIRHKSVKDVFSTKGP